jgi:MYXO-CTERM domain-containing protein
MRKANPLTSLAALAIAAVALSGAASADVAGGTAASPAPYCEAHFINAGFNTNNYVNSVEIQTLAHDPVFANRDSGVDANLSGYQSFMGSSPITLRIGESYLLRVQIGSGPVNQKVIVWIDFNGDKVFANGFCQPSERIMTGAVYGGALAWKEVTITVPQTANPGLTRMRVKDEGYDCAMQPCGTVVTGEYEDYPVLIVGASSTAPGQPPAAQPLAVSPYSIHPDGIVGQAYQSEFTGVGGFPPYTWSMTPVANAAWISLNSTAGLLFGTPPASMGSTITKIAVTVTDSHNQTATQNVDIPVKVIRSVPDIQRYDSQAGLPGDYMPQLNSGAKARATVDPSGGKAGGDCLRLDSSNLTNQWTLDPASDGARSIILWTYTLWNFPGPISGEAHTGIVDMSYNTLGMQDLVIGFDYKIVNQSGVPQHAALLFDYSRDEGVTWDALHTEKQDNTGGMHWEDTFGQFVTDHGVIHGLGGNTPVVQVRAIWMVKNGKGTANEDYILVDNIHAAPLASLSANAGAVLAVEDKPMSHTYNAAGGIAPFTYSLTTEPLSAWMSIDPSTGVLSGTPPAGRGVYTAIATIKAMDLMGQVVTMPVSVPVYETLKVQNVDPSVYMRIVDKYDHQAGGLGGKPVYQWDLVTDPSSAWLSINSTTGRITGTPPASVVGTLASFDVKLTDGSGQSALTHSEVNVVDILAIVANPNMPKAVEGKPLNYAISTTGGAPNPTWTLVSAPAWLTLNPTTGIVTGTPPAGSGHTSVSFAVSAADSIGETANQSFSMEIVFPLFFTSGSVLPEAVVDAPYQFSMLAGGGEVPYTYSITTNANSAWLSIDAQSGLLSGTAPKVLVGSTVTVDVQVADGSGQVVARPFAVDVVGTPSAASDSAGKKGCEVAANGSNWGWLLLAGLGVVAFAVRRRRNA